MSNRAGKIRTVGTFAVAVLLFFARPTNPAFSQQSLRDRIIGTWKLISWETVRADGKIENIWMGAHPTGLIIYAPTGYMAVEVMADPRPTFARDVAASEPTPDELKQAFFGYYAYWGTYAINEAGTGVIHTLLGSERPNEVGRKYPRTVTIEGGKIVLNTPAVKASVMLPKEIRERAQIPADEELSNRLTFERAE